MQMLNNHVYAVPQLFASPVLLAAPTFAQLPPLLAHCLQLLLLLLPSLPQLTLTSCLAAARCCWAKRDVQLYLLVRLYDPFCATHRAVALLHLHLLQQQLLRSSLLVVSLTLQTLPQRTGEASAAHMLSSLICCCWL
jgi:hypothetical protein